MLNVYKSILSLRALWALFGLILIAALIGCGGSGSGNSAVQTRNYLGVAVQFHDNGDVSVIEFTEFALTGNSAAGTYRHASYSAGGNVTHSAGNLAGRIERFEDGQFLELVFNGNEELWLISEIFPKRGRISTAGGFSSLRVNEWRDDYLLFFFEDGRTRLPSTREELLGLLKRR